MICDQCETVKHCTKYGCIPERIGKPKPAAQRQPSWVGLTDEEQTEIMSEAKEFVSRGLIDLVEAKLKEKNNG